MDFRHRMREGAFQAPQRQSDRAVVDDRDYGDPDEGCEQEADPEIHDRFDHWHNPALDNAVTPQGTQSDSARESSFELKSCFIFLRIAKNSARNRSEFHKNLRGD